MKLARVAGDDAHVFDTDAESIRDDLREHREVPLTLCAHTRRDAHGATRFNRDARALIRTDAGALHVAGDADAHPAALRAKPRLLFAQKYVIADDFRRLSPRFREENLERNKALVDKIKDLAAAKGCIPGQLVLAWLLKQGGLAAIGSRNARKAEKLYGAIDRTDFYRGHAQADSRSRMNVTFRLPSEELEKKFVKDATAAGLDGLKGHRSVGGLRASIYNAFPEEGVDALVQFMSEFERRNG